MGHTYAIGDIQGCDEELGILLKRLHFNPDRDRLWFAGDIVNRGPKSLAALRRVHSLRDNAVVVLGNHDLHLLAVARSDKRSVRSSDTLDEILEAPDCDVLLDWLERRPLMHYDAHLNFALLHAGLPPQWDLPVAQSAAREVEEALAEAPEKLYSNMYGDKPDRWSDGLQGYDRLRFIVNCFTRMRFCDAEGRIELKVKGGLDKTGAGHYPWFRAPNRRSRSLRIVFGHWSALGVHFEDNIFAIDGGCVWGGGLCAVRLDESLETTIVPCKGYQDIE